jgi:hypothetical protein
VKRAREIDAPFGKQVAAAEVQEAISIVEAA